MLFVNFELNEENTSYNLYICK